MPEQSRHHSAQETCRGDLLIPLRGRTPDGGRRPPWYGRAIRLTAIFDEHQLTFGDMAPRTNKGVMLNTMKTRGSPGPRWSGSAQSRTLYSASLALRLQSLAGPYPILAVETLAKLCRV
jgi:hypothetical protein